MTAIIVGLTLFIALGMIAFCAFMVLKERDQERKERAATWQSIRESMNRISELQKQRSQILDELLDVWGGNP